MLNSFLSYLVLQCKFWNVEPENIIQEIFLGTVENKKSKIDIIT